MLNSCTSGIRSQTNSQTSTPISPSPLILKINPTTEMGWLFSLHPFFFPLPNEKGAGLGLANENETSLYPFVVVEFDTYGNKYYDPCYDYDVDCDHVAIDINSVVSMDYVKWYSGVKEARTNYDSINYDSASTNLTVTFTNFYDDGSPFENNLSYAIDLRKLCLNGLQLVSQLQQEHPLRYIHFTHGISIPTCNLLITSQCI